MPSSTSRTDVSFHLPLHPSDYLILLSLVREDLHGYGILKAISMDGAREASIDPGNLYRRLHKMLNAAWVERNQTKDSKDDRRRSYRLTELGRRVAHAETARLRRLVESQAARSLSAEMMS
ncbi:MAG: PadR family transcriptional regulator [Thermoanaerobaculia bacterium]|nr:PadR family transcriptional regulator [Thermoanaerobaculia bacterium]